MNRPATGVNEPESRNVSQALLAHIQALSFQGYLYFLCALLQAMGYRDIEVKRRHWRGRTTRGGRDIEMSVTVGATRTRLLVQAKHYARPVQRRFVDELRGAMLRDGAQHGILITTSTFPRGAYAAAASKVAPIRLIDGHELVKLCFRYRIGVRPSQHPKTWCVDNDLFARLHASFPPNPPSKPTDMCHNGASPFGGIPVWQSIQSTITGGDMTWRTHTLAGVSSIWLLALVPHGLTPYTLATSALAAAFGSLLPDLDAAESKIKHLRIAGITPLAPVAVLFHRGLGHRGLLHSLAGLSLVAMASLFLIPAFGWQTVAALIAGYASHLTADALTRSGIPWLYPSPKRYHLLPERWCFVTGSHAETALMPFLMIMISALLLRLVVLSATSGSL